MNYPIQEVKPKLDIVHIAELDAVDEFWIEVNDFDGGLKETTLLCVARTKKTAIRKALRVLKRFIKQLEKED